MGFTTLTEFFLSQMGQDVITVYLKENVHKLAVYRDYNAESAIYNISLIYQIHMQIRLSIQNAQIRFLVTH